MFFFHHGVGEGSVVLFVIDKYLAFSYIVSFVHDYCSASLVCFFNVDVSFFFALIVLTLGVVYVTSCILALSSLCFFEFTGFFRHPAGQAMSFLLAKDFLCPISYVGRIDSYRFAKSKDWSSKDGASNRLDNSSWNSSMVSGFFNFFRLSFGLLDIVFLFDLKLVRG